jgi:putative DNA methylase
VRYYGRWMRDEAETRIRHLYPNVRVTPELAAGRPDLRGLVGAELTVIAWLWARTVASPNPACRGAHVPLVSSFMLSTKAGKEAWVEPVLDPVVRDGYRFEIRTGKISPGEVTQKKTGTKAGGPANFRCLLTGTIIKRIHIVTEGKAGRMGARLMAIVAEGKRGRVYLPPIEEHERIAASAIPTWAPETDLPKKALGFRVQEYGITKHRDLFTPRQLVALTTFSDLVLEARAKALEDAKAAGMDPDPTPLADGGTGALAYADSLAVYLAFALDKVSNLGSSVTGWMSDRGAFRETFARQAIPMTWDFAEANLFSDSGGNFLTPIEKICTAVAEASKDGPGKVQINDAANGAKFGSQLLIATDPPYYDNVPYADLSDFFMSGFGAPCEMSFRASWRPCLCRKKIESWWRSHRGMEGVKAQRTFL